MVDATSSIKFNVSETTCNEQGRCTLDDASLTSLIYAMASDGKLGVAEKTALLNAAGSAARLDHFLAKVKGVGLQFQDEAASCQSVCDENGCRVICGDGKKQPGAMEPPKQGGVPTSKSGCRTVCDENGCREVCGCECKTVCDEQGNCKTVCECPDGCTVTCTCEEVCDENGCRTVCECTSECDAEDSGKVKEAANDPARLAEKQKLIEAIQAGGPNFAANVKELGEKFPDADLTLFLWGKDCAACKQLAGDELEAGQLGGKIAQVKKMIEKAGGSFADFMISDGEKGTYGWYGLGISPSERREAGLPAIEDLPVMMRIVGGQVVYESSVHQKNWLDVTSKRNTARAIAPVKKAA